MNQSQIAIALARADWPRAKTSVTAALRAAGIKAGREAVAAAMALCARRHEKRAEREARAAAAKRAEKHGLALRLWAGRRAELQRVIDARPDLRRAARLAAGLGGSNNPPVVVVSGSTIEGRRNYRPIERGTGYDFRWRGRWKTAPGSYIPSNRRVCVPATWLALRLLREAEAGR